MGLQPGTKLSNYEIVSPLGMGGMGEVYRQREVARVGLNRRLTDLYVVEELK
jgi:hypothetical protein